MSSFEDVGTPDKVVDALNIIVFEDKKGAARLLNRAVQSGVKFSERILCMIQPDKVKEEAKKKRKRKF